MPVLAPGLLLQPAYHRSLFALEGSDNLYAMRGSEHCTCLCLFTAVFDSKANLASFVFPKAEVHAHSITGRVDLVTS